MQAIFLGRINFYTSCSDGVEQKIDHSGVWNYPTAGTIRNKLKVECI